MRSALRMAPFRTIVLNVLVLVLVLVLVRVHVRTYIGTRTRQESFGKHQNSMSESLAQARNQFKNMYILLIYLCCNVGSSESKQTLSFVCLLVWQGTKRKKRKPTEKTACC